jgi:hypothetical protein
MSRKKPTKQARRITLRDIEKMPPDEQQKHLEQYLPEFFALRDEFQRQQAIQEQIRAKLAGDGDGSRERFLLEMRELTGLDFNELAEEMPLTEVYAIAKAALRKRESENWVPVAIEDLRHDKAGLSRYAAKANSGLRRKGRGEYLVHRNRLAFFVKPISLNKYQA